MEVMEKGSFLNESLWSLRRWGSASILKGFCHWACLSNLECYLENSKIDASVVDERSKARGVIVGFE